MSLMKNSSHRSWKKDNKQKVAAKTTTQIVPELSKHAKSGENTDQLRSETGYCVCFFATVERVKWGAYYFVFFVVVLCVHCLLFCYFCQCGAYCFTLLCCVFWKMPSMAAQASLFFPYSQLWPTYLCLISVYFCVLNNDMVCVRWWIWQTSRLQE